MAKDKIARALAYEQSAKMEKFSEYLNVFGVAWDKTQSSSAMTRTGAAVGKIAAIGIDDEVVRNDFDDMPIYRDIELVFDEQWNEFVRIPKFYIRKVETDDMLSIDVSPVQYDGFYLPKCFWDFSAETELDYVDVGRFEASLNGTLLESKADKYPLINKNIQQFRDYARNNGAGYQQLDVHVVDVIQTLFYVEFATLHSQSVMTGFTSGRYTNSEQATVAENGTNRIIVENADADQYRVGQAISVGTSQGGNQIFYGRSITSIDDYDGSNKSISFDGDPVDIAVGNYLYNTGWKTGFSDDIAASSGCIGDNSGKYPMSYRGIENIYGSLWKWVDGVNIDDWQAYVCDDAEDYMSDLFIPPYKELSYVNQSSNGYPIKMGLDEDSPYCNLPVELGGSSSTRYADYYYQNSGNRVARLGGGWSHGSLAGLSCWSLHTSSADTSVYIGGRLLKKPL